METKPERVRYIDIAKGLGIILVVIGHSYAPGELVKFIYMFHMPLFFLISGLLYNDRTDAGTFVKRKVLSLYVPYVVWNCISILIQFMVAGGGAANLVKRLGLTACAIQTDAVYFDPTWFLAALFWTSVLYKLLDRSLKKAKYSDITITLVFLIAVFLLDHFKAGYIYWYIHKMVENCLFFCIGASLKKRSYKIEEEGSFLKSVFWLLLCAIAAHWVYNYDPDIAYTNNIFLFILAICVSLSVIYLCYLYEQKAYKLRIFKAIGNAVSYVGRHSIDILIWHPISFLLTSSIIVLLKKEILPQYLKETMITYNIIYSVPKYGWVIFSIAGIVLPLIWCSLMRLKPLGKITKKLHLF